MKTLITTIIFPIFFIGSLLSANIYFNFQNNDPEQMIMGKWVSENNPEFVWEFLSNGVHKTYTDGQLTNERSWEIVNECEGETADNEYDFAMLEISRDGNLPAQCYVVQGLNGVLTLLALPQGRLIIFDRFEN